MLTQNEIDEWRDNISKNDGFAIKLIPLAPCLYDALLEINGHEFMGAHGFVRGGLE